MRPLAAVLLCYAAVAAGFAATARSSGRPIPVRVKPVLAMLAVAALVAAGALWPRADGAVFAGLCVAMASSAMATGFALLEPLWPRAIWGLAIAAPVVAGLLAASAL